MSKQKTDSRTETRVEAVEVELFQCPLCEQEYEDDELMEVYAGVKRSSGDGAADFEAEDKTEICGHCAETIGLERAASYKWGPAVSLPDSLERFEGFHVKPITTFGYFLIVASFLGMFVMAAMLMVGSSTGLYSQPPVSLLFTALEYLIVSLFGLGAASILLSGIVAAVNVVWEKTGSGSYQYAGVRDNFDD